MLRTVRLFDFVQPLPHLRGNFTRTGSQALFVHAQDTFALHQYFTFADRGVNRGVYQTKDQMSKEIRFTERCWWLVVKDGKISRQTFSDHAQLQAELALGNCRIVLKQ